MFKELFTESRNQSNPGDFIAKEMYKYLVNGKAKSNGYVTTYTKGTPMNEFSVIYFTDKNGVIKDKDTDTASKSGDYTRHSFTAKKLKAGWKINNTYGDFKQYNNKKLQDQDAVNLLKNVPYKG